ncbi:hypothetical protein EGH21_15020 [Halomicroarcula sp. F13]|uniref:SipW-cognate class signal peptide n=1 Tax=Haloarcula rubra TaxID=2487747 RepID=A0AAW4PSY1_9EURY|nr:hypothetical protein [Halomicroarcula rubra]MBX0324340.1 hypothetical protein [Halomicroarcula rubra]
MTRNQASGQKIAVLAVVTAITLATGVGGFYTASVLSDSESVVSSFTVGNSGNVGGTAETTTQTETETATETETETETETATETETQTETTTEAMVALPSPSRVHSGIAGSRSSAVPERLLYRPGNSPVA